MAGADYLKCEVCAERIMFEPDADPDIKVVCMDCYKKLLYTTNNVLRSTSTIIGRRGEQTNWEAFGMQVKHILDHQHVAIKELTQGD